MSEALMDLDFPRGRDLDPNGQVLRFSVEEYNGHEYVSLRIWFRAPDGTMKPTKIGVTIRSRELDRAAKWLSGAALSIGADSKAGRSPKRRELPQASIQDVQLPPEQESELF